MSDVQVAAAVPLTTWEDGLALVDAGADCARALAGGDWVEAGLAGVALGLDAVSTALDPVGTLLTGGAAWVLEHVHPLPEMLDSLAGRPADVLAAATTWHGVAASLHDARAQYDRATQIEPLLWEGTALAAFTGYAFRESSLLAGLAVLADGAGAGIALAGQLVSAVRLLVRDLVASCVAQVARALASAVATGGLLTPGLAGWIAAVVASTVARVAGHLRALVGSLTRLGGHLGRARGLLEESAALLRRAAAPHRALPYHVDGVQPLGPGVRLGVRVDPRAYAEHVAAKGQLVVSREVATTDDRTTYGQW